ncbi:MAG: dihydropteroate synthase [Bacteroidetes bacterium]|nr:dihydropteroate synthase [Bacteroidota bacterium]
MQKSTVKSSIFSKKTSLRLGEKLLFIDKPLVMGVLNLSPESFYVPVREAAGPEWFLSSVEKMLPYIDIIDVGAVSTRPGAVEITPEEEISRFEYALPRLRKAFPDTFFSADTYRSQAAEAAVASGACLINDVSGGGLDVKLLPTIARLQVPYVLSHMLGTPATMQDNPYYKDVVKEIIDYFARKLSELHELGIHDIILDPGFGFGKSVEHNYQIIKNLEEFLIFELPVMAGLSRKSMIQNVLKQDASGCLNGTTVLNTIALMKGASILRVHDVKEAREVVTLIEKIHSV